MYLPATSETRDVRGRRINTRVSEEQERTLRTAAAVKGETLTGFVLSAASDRAVEVLEHAQRMELRADAFARFLAALDRPVEEMPPLRRYARKQSPIPAS
jgi:uncharacterized protein (DUF1778 family)